MLARRDHAFGQVDKLGLQLLIGYCEERHVMTMVNLVEAGMGIAAVPRLAMPADDHPMLVSFHWKNR